MIIASDHNQEASWISVASAALAFTLQHGLLRMFLASQKAKLSKAHTEVSSKKTTGRLLSILCAPNCDEGANRLVATTHALCAVVLGFLSLTLEFRPCGSSLGPIQRIAMSTSLGYFSYDLLFELIKADAYDMVVHHIFAVIGLSCGLATNRSGTELMGSIFAAELSTPLLHLRFFLRHQRSSPEGRKLFDFVSIVFLAVFLTFRISTIGLILTWHTLTSPSSPFLVKFSGLTLYLISCYWASLLVRMALRRVKAAAATKDINS